MSGARRPPAGGAHGAGPAAPDERLDRDVLIARLAAAREPLAAVAGLSEAELDRVPAAGSFRFCDGRRTLEQVLGGLLTHQGHDLDALRPFAAG